MKRLGLFLLAVVLVAGTGCSGRDPDHFYPSFSSMAGVYNLTKMTVTQDAATITKVPPEISGAISLGSAGAYSIDFTIPGDHIIRSGTYTVSQTGTDDFIVMDGSGLWHIRDDGLKLESLWFVLKGNPTTFVCTRI